MVPQLEKGCCGCTLHTSSLVIGWIQLVWSLLWLLVTCVAGTFTLDYILSHSSSDVNPENKDETKLMAQIMLGVVIVVLLISFLIDLGLLIGVYKRNYCLMMPYLILSGIGNVMSILGLIVIFISAFSTPALFGKFFVYAITTGLGVYFWLIVFSYYKEVKTQALVNQNNFNKI